jgi:hypothetical protein
MNADSSRSAKVSSSAQNAFFHFLMANVLMGLASIDERSRAGNALCQRLLPESNWDSLCCRRLWSSRVYAALLDAADYFGGL